GRLGIAAHTLAVGFTLLQRQMPGSAFSHCSLFVDLAEYAFGFAASGHAATQGHAAHGQLQQSTKSAATQALAQKIQAASERSGAFAAVYILSVRRGAVHCVSSDKDILKD